ncbi:zinc-dependent peptidase [Flavobacterium flavipallidum]|uniref:Zinc-dependent peptidase n=1 Tax=Flavobacterium flavipallidum TaxID=3139140 RepID=A0ABU9HPU4_9FLAO
MNIIFQILVLLLLVFLSVVFIFKFIVEPVYVALFNKPIYIHYYYRIRKLSIEQSNLLEYNFSFYRNLTNRKKSYFNHRVASFVTKYQFIGKGGFEVTEEVKLLLAATYVMLTFGMRHYRINNFDKIIIYCESYYSVITKQYHKGEFNPALKALVFSWNDFHEGIKCENDNLNLGLHEFSHALYFHGLKGRDQSSVVFADGYDKIVNFLKQPDVLKGLVESNYFRIYAYTNQAEFMAVVLEHFFETPSRFKQEHPELFSIVAEMINIKEEYFI